MSYKVAREFWTVSSKYPRYPNTKQRRLIDLNFVLSVIDNPESVIDIGCADGYLLILLRELTDIERFYGYDINGYLLDSLKERWGNDTILHTNIYDMLENKELPTTDLTLCMGLFPYIFKDEDVNNILSNIQSDTLIIRSPCTLKPKAEYINKYSDDLGCEYSSIYRTRDEYMMILMDYYNRVEMVKSYPDNIESKFGTKHYYFVCEDKK